MDFVVVRVAGMVVGLMDKVPKFRGSMHCDEERNRISWRWTLWAETYDRLAGLASELPAEVWAATNARSGISGT